MCRCGAQRVRRRGDARTWQTRSRGLRAVSPLCNAGADTATTASGPHRPRQSCSCFAGTIPADLFSQLPGLQIIKMGRNPIRGTVPALAGNTKLQKYNCNFCALGGTFPDIFTGKPDLIEAYWCVRRRDSRAVVCVRAM